jgi:ubiquinol-cytochrome c reductase cytochrome c subunit
MGFVRFVGLMGFVVSVAANPVLAQSAQANQPKADADNGRRVYMKTGCYQCHGREGQGSPATGPRLGPNPSPFAAFAAWVRQPRGDMPPYTNKVLTDAELADIYAFVRTRQGPAPASRLPY